VAGCASMAAAERLLSAKIFISSDFCQGTERDNVLHDRAEQQEVNLVRGHNDLSRHQDFREIRDIHLSQRTWKTAAGPSRKTASQNAQTAGSGNDVLKSERNHCGPTSPSTSSTCADPRPCPCQSGGGISRSSNLLPLRASFSLGGCAGRTPGGTGSDRSVEGLHLEVQLREAGLHEVAQHKHARAERDERARQPARDQLPGAAAGTRASAAPTRQRVRRAGDLRDSTLRGDEASEEYSYFSIVFHIFDLMTTSSVSKASASFGTCIRMTPAMKFILRRAGGR
jgi:hypothetical protein